LAYGKDLKGGTVPGLALVPGIIAFAGGLPVMTDDKMHIGGIGVSGGTADQDDVRSGRHRCRQRRAQMAAGRNAAWRGRNIAFANCRCFEAGGPGRVNGRRASANKPAADSSIRMTNHLPSWTSRPECGGEPQPLVQRLDLYQRVGVVAELLGRRTTRSCSDAAQC
jgi:Haem-degrading